MAYKVTAPLVIIPNADPEKGGDGYFYADAVVPDGFNDERCKQLAEEGMLEKVDGDSSSEQTVDEVLADVGEDKDKAAAALKAENARSKPRKSLVGKLEAIAKGE